jgi:leader peptidase (prepilin peptidase)/N-methyltransferase
LARRALTPGRDAPFAGRTPDAMNRINPDYVVAALLGLSAAAVSIWAAPGLSGFLGAGLALLMAAIAVIDARHLIIPNELNAAALALALINAAALAPGAIAESLAEALLRGAATFLLFFALRVAYRRLRGREGIGLGDVKLAFVAGVWLGWTLVPVAIEIAAGAALLAYLTWRGLAKHPLEPAARLPFGLFFAPAIWLAWFIGAAIAAG